MQLEAVHVRLRNGDIAGALGLLDMPHDQADAAWHAVRGMALLADRRMDEALTALRMAMAAGDTTPATVLNLALAEDGAGFSGEGLARMRWAEENWPDWDEPSLRQAESLRAAGRHAEAEQAYARTLEISPERIEALLGLGALRIARGDGLGAQCLLLRCCGMVPGRADAWDALGVSLLLTRDIQAAEAAFAKAQHLAPDMVDYALHRLDAAFLAGNAEAELARLDLACLHDPLDSVAATARGLLLEKLGRRAEAIDALEVAVALAPEAKLPTALLGGVLARSHRLKEAELALSRAIALDPDSQQLRNDRATVLMRLHRHAEARQELHRVLEKDRDSVVALCNLANVTVSLGLQAAAVAIARRAIAVAPAELLSHRALCNTLPYWEGITGAELLNALHNYAALLARADEKTRQEPLLNTPDPERRLRLGLLSGTLRTHPVGWLTVAAFETLDPAGFDIVCLGRNAAPDPIALRYGAVASEWHDTEGMDDATLARRARALGIDILIDLGGYGDSGRMPACALRLAPVQMKWVGMQNHSSGLPEMDWLITDAWETPLAQEHFYSERMLRLPDGYVCYSPPPYAPDVGPLPARRNGHVTFGCFNNLAKVTPCVIAAWAGVLRRVPDARLVLKTHQFSEAEVALRVRASFAAHGIDSWRLELRGSSAHRNFLGEYNDIDIVLDPFPYSGGLTTCEALWMGVPTVTLPGETFASRHSLSHLSNVGLHDWITADLTAYVDMAAARAGDLEGLAALRSGLRARMKASPLCDAPRFGRGLGGALRHAWRDWCASAPGSPVNGDR